MRDFVIVNVNVRDLVMVIVTAEENVIETGDVMETMMGHVLKIAIVTETEDARLTTPTLKGKKLLMDWNWRTARELSLSTFSLANKQIFLAEHYF